jgi:hypothetical protein
MQVKLPLLLLFFFFLFFIFFFLLTYQARNWFQSFAFKSNLYRYAEVIHARWAMLAIPGIVIPEARVLLYTGRRQIECVLMTARPTTVVTPGCQIVSCHFRSSGWLHRLSYQLNRVLIPYHTPDHRPAFVTRACHTGIILAIINAITVF